MITLINGAIQDASGNPIVPLGYIELYLNTDAQVIASPEGQVLGGTVNSVRFFFDKTGNLIQPCEIWSNSELFPQNLEGLGTHYIVNFYDENGTRLNNAPMIWVFSEPAGSTVDIGTMVNTSPSGPFYPEPFVIYPVGSHLFYGGPDGGPDANPTFRAIQPDDLPIGTTGTFGIVKPDGNTITISGGVLTAVTAPGGITAITASYPVVSSGGSTPNLSVATATNSSLGVMQPDGTTITISGGIITATTPVFPYPPAGIPLSTGTAWAASFSTVPYSYLPTSADLGTAGVTVDGGIAVPATGAKGFYVVPYNCVITSWDIMGNTSGSVQFDVQMATAVGGIGSTTSIVASAPPAMTSAQSASSSTLTGWTTTLVAGNLLSFYVTSVTTLVRVTLQLNLQKT